MSRKLTVLFLSSMLAACGAEKTLSDKEYAQKASESMKEEVYDLAIQQYQKLLEEYPFSDYSEEAQLKIGQAQYENKQYAEAIASFQDFQRMHPTNPNLALTEYYSALAYIDQMGDAVRDQRAAENAQAHLQTLLQRYPESPFSTEAKARLKKCREVLANHELDIGKFYLIWTNPIGAEARLRRLLENYPDTDVAAAGLMHFGNYFRERGDLSRAALAYASLINQYPKSGTLDAARRTLDQLKEKQVSVPDNPLPALVESLGRPSVATAPAPLPSPEQPAAKVSDAGAPGSRIPARN